MSLFRSTARLVALGLTAGALAVTTVQPAQAASISEGFDDVSTLTSWQKVNLSSASLSPTTWRQGNPEDFAAHSGAPGSYIAVDYTSGGPVVSNWLISPKQTSLSSTDVLSFWTRTIDLPMGTVYPDRLEVRMSTNGSCDPGTTSGGVGDFTTVLANINPNLAADGYPRSWTQYTLPLTGLSTTNVSGCLAFRYVIPSTDNAGETVGIDSLSFVDNASVACTSAQGSVTSAQTAVTTATATAATTTRAVAKAKKVLKKAKKKLKKAKKSDATDKVIKKAKKKVKKAKKVVKRATAKNVAATAAVTTAQTALTSAQSAATTSCP